MMKYIIAAACIASVLFTSCGQQMKMVQTAKTDSLAVEAVWKQYVRGLSSKNAKVLKKLSLKQVYCQPCAIQAGTGDLVTADAFIQSMFTTLPKTQLWQAVKTSRHLIVTEQIKNYKPLNLNVTTDALLVHDVWFVTRQPDKVKGFESQRYAFQFVKDAGQYKFFGLTAVN
ncbi:hypothetical protein [Mucilaginibacter aquatilis]|uniref:Nuclear transport factor 2 family protein n=1 Tax=Mucilaginibacter aquatilis TaxID=1517760 RepID=A0A6I4ICH0_9SPHI|nr:hypothetical protein [Mucilaginibacter aquatilis]MVN92945.1 hypothetical protein [Mucilaginibacter aquatilis]